jgi:hypothetical protein
MAKQTTKVPATQRISNTFEGGMESDLDKRLREPNTYKLSVNGKLIYNKEGSLAWENVKGNKKAIDGYTGIYRTMGIAEFTDFVIVMSKREGGWYTRDEIGYITFDENGNGVYRVLHHDGNDEYDLKLNFNKEYPIQTQSYYEGDNFIRVYFTDDYNEPRVFTCYKDAATGLLERLTTSEWSMNITPDFSMGVVDYQGLIGGSLRSGNYQYSYRLKTTDGYQTPWSPPTNHVIITGRVPSETQTQEAYGMADVDVLGSTGAHLKISKIDTRYQDIEVAYIHSITENAIKESGIFVQKKISGSTMTFDHTSIENIVPINDSEFRDLKDVIKTAKTIQIKDNRLWFGNTSSKPVFNIPEAVLSNAWCEPEFRAVPVDVIGDRVLYNGKADGGFRPVKVYPRGSEAYYTRDYRRYDGGSETYRVKRNTMTPANGIKDYMNYQGSQTNHMFKGYFRGEVYRFAIVFYDKKGYPFFAKHLADMTTPHHISMWGGRNFTIMKRLRDDGTATWQTCEIGNMGGIPTDRNYDYAPFYTNGSAMGGQNANINRPSGAPIEDQYKLAENSPAEGGLFKSTPFINNNPNNLGTSNERNVGTWEKDSWRYIVTRVLGFRFGGVNLDVVVDEKGTKLKDIIGGIQIVRAERTGANEQVKDTGIILNTTQRYKDGKRSQGTDTKERLKTWVNPSPVFGGQNNPTGGNDGGYFVTASHKYLNEGGGEVNKMAPMDYQQSFWSVNAKVAGTQLKVKQGITKMRLDFICNPSNLVTKIKDWSGTNYYAPSNNNEVFASLQGNLVGDFMHRHYVSKVLDTWNTRALSVDTYNRWIQCNALFNVSKVSELTNPGTEYGFFNGTMVGTLGYLAGSDGGDEDWISLKMFSNPRYDGGGVDKKNKNNRMFLAAASEHHIVSTGCQFTTAFGITAAVGLSNAHQALSVYSASWLEPNKNPYGGVRAEAIQNTRFFSTGHFLPVDDDMLTEINNGGNHVVDEMEVWGGDCILDVWSFLKHYPLIEHDSTTCIPDNNGKEANKDQSGDSRIDLTDPGEWRDYSHGLIVPIESKHNYRLTYKDSANAVKTWAEVGTTNAVALTGDGTKTYFRGGSAQGIFLSSVPSACDNFPENFQIQAALQYFDRVRPFFTKPVDFIDITDHPTRWHWSNLKQPTNQRIDNFRYFEEISNFDLDGNYGEIVGSAKLNDNIYSLQKSNFSRLRINERALAGTDIGSIQLGEGGTMDGAEIISHQYGTQHRDSVTTSDKSIYFIDAAMSKIFRFGGDGLTPISDSKGIHTSLEKYLTALRGQEDIINGNGIIASYDYGNSDVYFTIKDLNKGDNWEFLETNSRKDDENHNGNVTYVYNEDMQLFQGRITAYPTFYFRHGSDFYSNKNNGTGDFYIYNKGNRGQFFNQTFHSYLSIDINYQSRMVKKFDTSLWNVNEEALPNIRTVTFKAENTEHQFFRLSDEIVNIQGYQALTNRAKYREGTLRFPIRENKSKKPRLTGKTAELSLYYDNLSNDIISLSNIDTLIRFHNRK